jgi:hypothetical protein
MHFGQDEGVLGRGLQLELGAHGRRVDNPMKTKLCLVDTFGCCFDKFLYSQIRYCSLGLQIAWSHYTCLFMSRSTQGNKINDASAHRKPILVAGVFELAHVLVVCIQTVRDFFIRDAQDGRVLFNYLKNFSLISTR